MDKDLYKIMKEIYQKEDSYALEKGKFLVKDVEHIGSIELNEKINDVDTKTVKDIFKVIEEMEDGSIVENYYDEQINFVAGRDKNGRMCLDQQAKFKDTNILEQIEDLREQPGLSLNQIENELEAISKELGISMEEVLAMSVIDLDQEIGNEKQQNQEQKQKLTLDEDEKEENKEEQIEKNEKALNNISSKQEIDMDKKVDDIHTLGQILGAKPGSKLIAVYSDSIENNKNTTRFSFVIKNADGTLENADMLNQVGGKTSNKDIYEVNRDGSEVTKKSVQSSYAIDSPLAKDGIITARVGDAGRIEIGYGQMDKTRGKDALTHVLKTDYTKDTTYKVREEFSYKKGTDNIKEDINEVREKSKHGTEGLTLEDADGQAETGIQDHLEDEKSENYRKNIIEEIKKYDQDIEEVFTDKEIEERLQNISKQHPDASFEEIVEKTKEDLSEDSSRINHYPGMERGTGE